jgi:hypothetical protein
MGHFLDSLAPTSFETGPKDEAAVVDVYEKVDVSEPINRITETKPSALSNLTNLAKDAISTATDNLKNLTDPNFIPKEIAKIKRGESILDGIPLSKDEALDALKKLATNGIGGVVSLETLKGDLLTDVLGSLGFKDNAAELAAGILGLPGSTSPIEALVGTNPTLKMLYDQAEYIRDIGDVKNASGVAALLGSLSGNTELAKAINMQDSFALINTAVSKAYKYNIPGIADKFLTAAGSPEERRGLALSLAKSAFPGAHLDTIQSILQVLDVDILKADQPMVIPNLLNGYRINADDPYSVNINNLATELINTLTAIDVNWNKYNRNGTYILDLSIYKHASDDARRVLFTIEEHRIGLMASDFYPSEDLFGLNRKLFKKLRKK